MAVSWICSGLPEEHSRKITGKMLESLSRIAKCFINSRHFEIDSCGLLEFFLNVKVP